MEKVLDNVQDCSNCRYFARHFSHNGRSYYKVNCGHCMRRELRNTKRKKTVPCGYWESVEIVYAEHRREIKEALIFIAERMEEFSMILKDDMENQSK